MTHKIFDANDKALEEHGLDPRANFTNHRERMLFDWNTLISRALRVRKIPVWNGIEGTEKPLKAFIENGRWLAKCECGGVEYVTITDPIFFCHECGNKVVDGKSRPVLFPAASTIKTIEKELMTRKVIVKDEDKLYPPIHQSRGALSVTDPRSWYPKGGR